jgi:hypothetical protein
VRAVIPADEHEAGGQTADEAEDDVLGGRSEDPIAGDESRGTTEEATVDVPGEIAEQVDPDFDEATYLRAFPDIADAVRRGVLDSGLAHFRSTGRSEKRLEKPEYRALLAAYAGPAAPHVSVDTLTISPSGTTLMTGWSDDRFNPLAEVNLETRAGIRHNWTAFPRLVRTDVERTLEARPGHRFGFLLVAAPVGGTAAPIDPRTANAPVFRFASGVENRPRREPAVATDADLRDLALAALPIAAAGELDTEVIYRILDQHVGVQLAAINRLIIDQARSRRLIERFGPERGRYRGSIISVLRGRADQIVPRLALVGGGPGGNEYEYIVVVTNSEQFEPALRAARVAEATLGLALAVVLQPGGDTAGTGEEVAADIARSDRLIFMDQSVLPRHPDWALRHSALVDEAPAVQTRVMGGLLYHPDGSLSHGGYYFEQETSLLPRPQDLPQRITTVRLKAVTHPAPVATRPSPPARAVAGVPAAFLSVDRAWFEVLGGFTRQYSRAVYDDIDLCLRSLKRGVPAWIHPLPLWYFERRSPARPEPSRGGMILNGWLLHRQWDSMIVPELLGPEPELLTPALLVAPRNDRSETGSDQPEVGPSEAGQSERGQSGGGLVPAA